MKKFAFLLLLIVAVACTPGEKAQEMSALGGGKQPANQQLQLDLQALKDCCDENARAMGAECCQQLDRMLAAHSGVSGMQQPQATMRTGRPVQLPDEIAANWPKVKLRVGPRDAEGAEIEVAVGETITPAGTPLAIEVKSFVPAFKMTASSITSAGAEATNPAAQVIIREADKPDWSGWLFANMPEVHAFEHEQYQVILLGGIAKE